jgi:hypothetical protein
MMADGNVQSLCCGKHHNWGGIADVCRFRR